VLQTDCRLHYELIHLLLDLKKMIGTITVFQLTFVAMIVGF